MVPEWINLHRCTLRQLEPKISNARYQLECCGRKNTIINVTGQQLHVIMLAMEQYESWLAEKEKIHQNPLLAVRTSEVAMDKRF